MEFTVALPRVPGTVTLPVGGPVRFFRLKAEVE